MQKDEPIGTGLAIGLIGFGVCIDFLQFLLELILIGGILNTGIDVLAMAGFWIMLHGHGGKVMSRRGASFVLTGIAEFVPLVNALPWWTLFAVYTVVMDKIRHSSIMQDETPAPRKRGGGSWRL